MSALAGTTVDAKSAYDARWKRVMDCVTLGQPDRMPVTLFATFWLAKYAGISYRQLMYDADTTAAIAERAVLELDPDTISPLVLQTAMGPTLDATGYKQLQWPGNGVGDHQPYQYLDREYMKPEEYDDFLFDPTGYYLRVYLPRIMGAFEGFSEFPHIAGGFYFRLFGNIRGFLKPALQKSWADVQKAAAASQELADHNGRFIARMAELGYPMGNIATTGAPFDVLGDYFRGARGVLTDMRRRGDKLLEACDKMRRLLVSQVVPAAKSRVKTIRISQRASKCPASCAYSMLNVEVSLSRYTTSRWTFCPVRGSTASMVRRTSIWPRSFSRGRSMVLPNASTVQRVSVNADSGLATSNSTPPNMICVNTASNTT